MKDTQLRWYLLAGLCGGLAEVVWISIYSAFSGASPGVVGSAITTTFWPAGATWPLAPYLGLVIHLGLSLLLALLLGSLLWRILAPRLASSGIVLVALVMLALVWKINFYLVLPVWNPGFIGLLPLSVTLISKLLFGLAMGGILTVPLRQRAG